MANLNDVAKIAGVTPTTVSRVINMRGSLSQKTIDRVHAAMRELNYQPNAMARSLQGKKSQLIGLIFPSVAYPFYARLSMRLSLSFLRVVIRRFCVTVKMILLKNVLI